MVRLVTRTMVNGTVLNVVMRAIVKLVIGTLLKLVTRTIRVVVSRTIVRSTALGGVWRTLAALRMDKATETIGLSFFSKACRLAGGSKSWPRLDAPLAACRPLHALVSIADILLIKFDCDFSFSHLSISQEKWEHSRAQGTVDDANRARSQVVVNRFALMFILSFAV